MTTSNLVFCSRHNFLLFDLLLLPLITGVDTVNSVHTYVVDSPSCSIFPAGYIAEVGKNWYDATSTFLVSAKEGLGSPEQLWSNFKRLIPIATSVSNWSAT